MSRLVDDVLDAWRMGERLLDELPPLDPDHETIRLEVDRLRQAYHELTFLRDRSLDSLAASEAALAKSHRLLDAVSARLVNGNGNVSAVSGSAADSPEPAS